MQLEKLLIEKTVVIMISFDNRWFFNLNKIDTFKIEDNPEQQTLEFNSEHFTYVILYWNEKDQYNYKADIYRDYDITELDPEVKLLVYTLNKLTGIETINSCCGHNDFPLSVTIQFSALQSIGLLVKIICKKFKNDFVLSTSAGIQNNSLDRVLLELHTTKKGKEAYEKANELAEELEKWVRVFH